jgi:hypothetical protein
MPAERLGDLFAAIYHQSQPFGDFDFDLFDSAF